MNAPGDAPAIAEFHTWPGADGRLHGVHRATGRAIEGGTARALRLEACALSVAATWRRTAERRPT